MDIKKVQKEMAEMIFYSKHPDSGKFEDLGAKEKKSWMDLSGIVLSVIDKMQFVLTSAVEKTVPELSREEKRERIQAEIITFNKGIRVFKKDLYPAGELAYKILDLKL